ncbi:hypothetical protein GCM10025868_45300 [Angustibacter aerolatus]|uniref:histidine kinase n=1 Tax=Angustibacter aerolatus TaxID=1162965 RepID=A0ABQ6JLX3_9ACTN|nr:hypothetical protein GCM10025868_45300 [Angustibacter aerolatus]
MACSGESPCSAPGQGDAEADIPPDAVLVLRGRSLPASDQRLLRAYASHAAALLQRADLEREAGQTAPLAAAAQMRSALLNAVSHDLRTPLAAARAAVSSLRSDDVEWSPEAADDLLRTADESLDRLSRLVVDLLDMSRVQAGAVTATSRPVGWDEVVPQALRELGAEADGVRTHGLDETAPVAADPVLLQRVVVNLVSNALRHGGGSTPLVAASEPRRPRRACASSTPGRGCRPGRQAGCSSPSSAWATSSAGDRRGSVSGWPSRAGWSRRCTARSSLEDTPGGGATTVVRLPAAGPSPSATDEDDEDVPAAG